MSDHDYPAVIDLASGVRVIPSQYLPEGMALFALPGGFISRASFSIRPDPWSPSPLHWPAETKTARQQALGHLEGLLDDLCRRWGMDPDKVWREPRQAEILDRTYQHQLRAEMLVGFLINDPRDYLKVIYTS